MIGANSARPAGWYLDWSRGRLSRRQLARLAKSYTPAKPDELRVLVVHHPPAAPPGGTARHLIGRLQEFSDAVNRIGVDLVLSGHFHMSYAQALPLQGGSAPRALCSFRRFHSHVSPLERRTERVSSHLRHFERTAHPGLVMEW